MTMAVKRVAIVGANKEGLSLLPVLLDDPSTRLAIIVDPNKDAMLFKLGELGYRISPKHHVHVTTNLDDIKKVTGLNVIINACPDAIADKFFDDPQLKGVEKLSPLSAKLLWGVRVAASQEEKKGGATGHTALLSSLREIVDAVRLTRDRNELLSDILNFAIDSTRAETGSVMLLSKEEGALHMEIARGMDEEVVRKIKVPLGEGIAGKVAKEGKPLIISGKAREDEFYHLKDRRTVQNALSVPLIAGREVIGVINVSSSAHSFTDEDLNFLTSLSGLAAEVIGRADEYEQLRVDAAKYSLWKELEASMSGEKPIHGRLNIVCKKFSELVSGLTCYIYLYDEERKKLSLKSSSLKDAVAEGAMTVSAGEGIAALAAASMKDTVLVDRTFEGPNKRAYAAFPMTAKGRLVGVFTAEISSPKGFTKFTESFIKDMVSLISENVFEHRRIEDEIARTKKLFSVDELGLEIFSLKDSKRLLPVIAAAAAEVLECEGAILRIDEKGNRKYEETASFGMDIRKAREHFSPIEQETAAEVLRKKEIVSREFSEEASPYVRGVLSCPLIHDGSVVGLLSFFNKFEKGSRYPRAFTSSDRDVISRLVIYIEKVLPAVIERLSAKEEWNISTPQVFERRVEEELSRARRYKKKVVLVVVRIAGFKGVDTRMKKDFIRKLIYFIREKTRRFDTVTMLDDETIGILYAETDDRVVEALKKLVIADAAPEFKKGISYGCAVFPEDGGAFSDLFSKAYISSRAGSTEEASVPPITP